MTGPRFLILDTPGTHLGLNGGFLEVRERSADARATGGFSYRLLHPRELSVRAVVVIGESWSVTGAALRALAAVGVPLFCLSASGRLVSVVAPAAPLAGGPLKIAQVAAALDGERRLEVARAVLAAKLASQVRHAAEVSAAFDLPALDIGKMDQAVLSARDVPTLRLIEAHASSRYFYLYASALAKMGITWSGRGGANDHGNANAVDPVNAALNLAFSVIEGLTRSAVLATGLMPEVGYLHETRDGKEALVYDLMESARWAGEAAVLSWVAGRVRAKGPRWSRGVGVVGERFTFRLTPAAVRRLFEELSLVLARRLDAVSGDGTGGRYVASTADVQARRLARWLKRDRGGGLDLRMNVRGGERSGYLSPRDVERLLKLGPADRRALGLRANTIHYLRKRAATGAPVRVYPQVLRKLSSPDQGS